MRVYCTKHESQNHVQTFHFVWRNKKHRRVLRSCSVYTPSAKTCWSDASFMLAVPSFRSEYAHGDGDSEQFAASIAHPLLTLCSPIIHPSLTHCSPITYCSGGICGTPICSLCSPIAHPLITYHSHFAHHSPIVNPWLTFCSPITHPLLTHRSHLPAWPAVN